MSKGARIRRLKEEQARLVAASSGVGPAVAPKHKDMILAVVRAFELNHKAVIPHVDDLATMISNAHQAAIQNGFIAYHEDLMQAIHIYFEKNFPDDPPMGRMSEVKRGLLDFLNMPSHDQGSNKPQSEAPGDGDREKRPEEIHPMEQSEDKDPGDSSVEIGGGEPGISDKDLGGPAKRPWDNKEEKDDS